MSDSSVPRRPEDLFRPETGRTYKEFWERVAVTREGAYLGVAGLMFDQPYTDEDMSVDGEAVASILASKLEIGPSHEVLEMGVGVGRIAEHVAPLCAQFHGMDISAGMIAVAKQRLARLKNVHLRAVERSDLSAYPDASLDRVYAQIVFIHLDREDVFSYVREAFRVLKSGGRAWFQTNNLLHPGGWRCFVGVVDETRRQGQANRGRVHFLTAPELRRYVEGAGFVIDEARSHLELVEQRFDFVVPHLQWDHSLIAVARKP